MASPSAVDPCAAFDYSALILGVYQKWYPDKVGDVPFLLRKYANCLDALYVRVCEKYIRHSAQVHAAVSAGVRQRDPDRPSVLSAGAGGGNDSQKSEFAGVSAQRRRADMFALQLHPGRRGLVAKVAQAKAAMIAIEQRRSRGQDVDHDLARLKEMLREADVMKSELMVMAAQEEARPRVTRKLLRRKAEGATECTRAGDAPPFDVDCVVEAGPLPPGDGPRRWHAREAAVAENADGRHFPATAGVAFRTPEEHAAVVAAAWAGVPRRKHAAVVAAAWAGVPRRKRRSPSRSTSRSHESRQYTLADRASNLSNQDLTETIRAAAQELEYRAEHGRKR